MSKVVSFFKSTYAKLKMGAVVVKSVNILINSKEFKDAVITDTETAISEGINAALNCSNIEATSVSLEVAEDLRTASLVINFKRN